jgi:hypothetical protein
MRIDIRREGLQHIAQSRYWVCTVAQSRPLVAIALRASGLPPDRMAIPISPRLDIAPAPNAGALARRRGLIRRISPVRIFRPIDRQPGPYKPPRHINTTGQARRHNAPVMICSPWRTRYSVPIDIVGKSPPSVFRRHETIFRSRRKRSCNKSRLSTF